MTCKTCNKEHHVCMNCGVEEWYYTYCSLKCLDADGSRVCETCNGWGTLGHDDDNDDWCDGFVKRESKL